MDFLIIILLILINSFLALAEMALITSKKIKLKALTEQGVRGAQLALKLSENPNQYLSTIQIGITLVGLFAGAFSGLTVARHLAIFLAGVPILNLWSQALAISIVVVGVTILSLTIGELVPKRIALHNPEKFACIVAPFLNAFSIVTTPLVNLLGSITDLVLNTIGIKPREELLVSEEEIKMLIKEGARTGIFEIAEKEIIERTFKLSDLRVENLMIPRNKIIWLDIQGGEAATKAVIEKHAHSYFPVAKASLDTVIGMVRTKDLLRDYLLTGELQVEKVLHKPLLIPEHLHALSVMEQFRKSGIRIALVVDEAGKVKGLISLFDITKKITGDLPSTEEMVEKSFVQRDDGSWLIDGGVSLHQFQKKLHTLELFSDNKGNYHTLGGFITHQLGRIPASGDTVRYGDYIIEVIDMDGPRVDKVLFKKG